MLKVTDLEMIYPGGVVGLHPTTLEFHRGQFTVLMGPSGAGKSTLLRCLNFLNHPTGGLVVVDNLGTLNGNRQMLRQHRCQTAMIFQQHQLIPRHTALQNALIGMLGRYGTLRSLFPFRRKDVEWGLECLDRVGLLEKAFTPVDQMSGGQQQRVGIARALIQRPSLILADEPVASLDPKTSYRVLEILHRITKEDGIPCIVSLHQVELGQQFADRVIGIGSGSIHFDGTPQELGSDILHKIFPDYSSENNEKPVGCFTSF